MYFEELGVALPDRTVESISKLESWASKNGVEMNNVTIAEFDDFGYGLQATDSIMEGTVVVSVPKKLMITVDNIKHSPMGNNEPSNIIVNNVCLSSNFS